MKGHLLSHKAMLCSDEHCFCSELKDVQSFLWLQGWGRRTRIGGGLLWPSNTLSFFPLSLLLELFICGCAEHVLSALHLQFLTSLPIFSIYQLASQI